MRKFVVKFEFSASDMESDGIYFKMLEVLEDAFPEVVFDNFFRAAIIPDSEISDEDFRAEEEFDRWVTTLVHSGEGPRKYR